MTDDNSSKGSAKRKNMRIYICLFFIFTAIGTVIYITHDASKPIFPVSNDFAGKVRTGPGTLDSIGNTINPYDGKCEWGSSGNTCLSAGSWLDWCMSDRKGSNITESMLDFCTYLMTGNDRGPLKPLPFIQTWNQTGHYYLINETFVPSGIVESIEKELSR